MRDDDLNARVLALEMLTTSLLRRVCDEEPSARTLLALAAEESALRIEDMGARRSAVGDVSLRNALEQLDRLRAAVLAEPSRKH